MDLIYTNANREDLGVLLDYGIDMAFGQDENNFECTIAAPSHCCGSGFFLYMEGTEYGGIIDGIESNNDTKEVIYSGRTWHGILNSKVILPLQDGEEPGSNPGRLPKGYSELEYIESSGTQYINTGFNPNQNTRVVMDCNLLAKGTIYTPFGTWNDANVGQYICLGYSSAPSSLYHGNAYKVGTTSIVGRHTIDANKGALYIDGKLEVTCSAATYSCAYPLFLFTMNDKGKPRDMNMSHMKLYHCQIYDNGTLIRDFVPCMDSNGSVGLYDVKNSKFYTNAGTDAFSAGDVVDDASGGNGAAYSAVTIDEADSDGNSLVGKYLSFSGEANSCIAFLVTRMGLSDLFEASAEDSGITISSYQMNRYIKGYDGIQKMLNAVDGKLRFAVQDGRVILSAVPVCDYTQDEEFDSDLVDFKVKKNFRTVNHLVCLGTGELENRTVIHLYADTSGNISKTQTQFGLDEFMDVYDYPNAESAEELESGGIDRLKSLWQPDELSVDFDADTDSYDIGDIVGAYDNVTQISVSAVIRKKIVTIRDGQITISYKVGE